MVESVIASRNVSLWDECAAAFAAALKELAQIADSISITPDGLWIKIEN